VVRGFVTDPTQAVAPAEAIEVTVSGTLAPGESPGDAAHTDQADGVPPDGQLATLDLSLLVNRWPGALYNAFVFATAERPDVTMAVAPAAQRVPPPPLVSGGLRWRNAAYALQWWVFALFAAYMWWRMVREDHEFGNHLGSDDEALGSTPPGTTRKATNV
jgi:hypothetical protein